MAQTCIVCLGDLESLDPDAPPPIKKEPAVDDFPEHPPEGPQATSVTNGKEKATQQPNTTATDEELVAHLLPCGHNLHNECLKPWVERANSCPICRANFNQVELYASIGGTVLSSYSVQDKQQEPIFDPNLLDGLTEEASHQGPCLICQEYNNGRESTLLCCDGCDNTSHPFCAGLDGVPAGNWYCNFCEEDPSVIRQPANNRRRRALTTRHRRRRVSRSEQSWARVWQSVRNNTGIDLDFPDNESDSHEAEAARAAVQNDIEQRARIAAEQGAGDRFRKAAAELLENRAQPRRAKTPDPESQEEIRAWNAFEKAKAVQGQAGPLNRRKRKEASATPDDQPPEQERVLKRPRASASRRPNANGESSTAGPAPLQEESLFVPSGPSTSTRPGRSFLQSLLKDMEVNTTPNDANGHVPDLVPFADGASSPQSPQASSPGGSPFGSPAGSGQATPRAGTPPPFSLARPESPPLSSTIIPIYPAAPTFPPYSPAEPVSADERRPRRPSRQRPVHRSPETSPERPNVSYSTKAEVQRMVGAALKPLYRKQEINKDEYTDINRDVCRLLYEQVAAAGGLGDSAVRDRLQKVAHDEVANAVKTLQSQNAATPAASAAADPRPTAPDSAAAPTAAPTAIASET